MPAVPPRVITGSAALLGHTRDDSPKTEGWADEAWGFYESCPEFNYGVNWKAKAISKVRLLAARPSPDAGGEPVALESGPAAEAVDAFAGGQENHAATLEAISVHLDVPGICYLVCGEQIDGLVWPVLSADELRLRGGMYEVQTSPGSRGWTALGPDAWVIKVWRPSRRRHTQAFSPAVPLLATLRELQRINEHIEATLVSRLAGAGILVTPSEITFPTKPENADAEDPFQSELMEAMTTPIKQRGTAAAYVPLHVGVPSAYVDKIQHITFWSELSDQILAMKESAQKRVAIGLEIPAEVILGMGDVNHWGQWFIEESAIKVSVDPTAAMITGDITTGYLAPVRAADSGPGWFGDEFVWFDTSELVGRPNKSEQATQAHDRLALNTPAYLRENGLEEADQPDDIELRQMAWLKLLESTTIAPDAMIALGLATSDEFAFTAASLVGGMPGETAPAPEVASEPAMSPPEPVAAPIAPAEAPQAAAAYGLLHRAFEKTGARLRQRYKTTLGKIDCPNEAVHMHTLPEHVADVDSLLVDAWAQVPVVAAALGVDAGAYTERLNNLAKFLILTRAPLTLKAVAEWMHETAAVPA